jgi:hypothetical protein
MGRPPSATRATGSGGRTFGGRFKAFRRSLTERQAGDSHLSEPVCETTNRLVAVETLVATKRPGDCDHYLREVGERKGRSVEIAERIRALRDAHAKKPSLLARLRRAGLLQS